MYKFILPSSGSICSKLHVESKSFLLKNWRYVFSSHRGKDCTLWNFPCWSQTCAWKMYNVNTSLTTWLEVLDYLPWIWLPLLEPPHWSFHISLWALGRRQKKLDVHLRSWSQAIECIFRYHRLISHITPSFLQDFD